MAELKLIPKDGPERCKIDAKELCEWAMKQEFETVIIFGFKDAKIYTRSSKNEGTLPLMGALAAAQMELWEK